MTMEMFFLFSPIETEETFPKELINSKENEYIRKLSINGKVQGYNQIINTADSGKHMRFIKDSDIEYAGQIQEIEEDHSLEYYKAMVNIYKQSAEFWKEEQRRAVKEAERNWQSFMDECDFAVKQTDSCIKNVDICQKYIKTIHSLETEIYNMKYGSFRDKFKLLFTRKGG